MMISVQTFYALIRRDMAIFKPAFIDRLINSAIWIFLNVIVFQYIFSQMGMNADYGAFMACGTIISNGLFEVMGNVARFVSDLQGDKTISYDLTLPLPHWMIMVRIAVTSALQFIAVAILIIPMAKILLWNQFSFEHVSWFKVSVLFLIVHIFYGYLALCIASYMKNLWSLDNIWCRIIFPFWWLGGFQFNWETLHAVSPMIAYVNLANPLTLCFEGIRSAMLGQEGYVSFWLCCLGLIIWTIIVAYVGTRKMMRRLDCVY